MHKLTSSYLKYVSIVRPLQVAKIKFLLGTYILFYVLLTVHLNITLVNAQLDAQFFYFIIRLLQSSTCFEQRRAHHQEVKLYRE